jgi:hypothetical protein
MESKVFCVPESCSSSSSSSSFLVRSVYDSERRKRFYSPRTFVKAMGLSNNWVVTVAVPAEYRLRACDVRPQKGQTPEQQPSPIVGGNQRAWLLDEHGLQSMVSEAYDNHAKRATLVTRSNEQERLLKRTSRLVRAVLKHYHSVDRPSLFIVPCVEMFEFESESSRSSLLLQFLCLRDQRTNLLWFDEQAMMKMFGLSAIDALPTTTDVQCRTKKPQCIEFGRLLNHRAANEASPAIKWVDTYPEMSAAHPCYPNALPDAHRFLDLSAVFQLMQQSTVAAYRSLDFSRWMVNYLVPRLVRIPEYGVSPQVLSSLVAVSLQPSESTPINPASPVSAAAPVVQPTPLLVSSTYCQPGPFADLDSQLLELGLRNRREAMLLETVERYRARVQELETYLRRINFGVGHRERFTEWLKDRESMRVRELLSVKPYD